MPGIGIGLGIGLGMGVGRPPGEWTPARIPGVAGWFSAASFDGLFQDAAAETPVTAVEQSIGRMSDRSPAGNHATQSGTARPVVSARTNLLTKTEDLTNAAWLKFGAPTVTGGQAAPDGSSTAFLIESAGGSPSFIGVATAQSSTITVRLITKGGTRATANFLLRNNTAGTNFDSATLNFSTGVIGAPWVSKSLGDGWWEITYTHSTGISPGDVLWLYAGATGGPLAAGQNWYLWHPQINDGPVALPYQMVDTASVYDTTDLDLYSYFDGADATLGTNAGGASTHALIVAEFRVGALAADQTIWSDRDGDTGLKLAVNTSGEVEFSGGNGTSIDTATVSGVSPGVDYVVSAYYDGANLSVQLDGAPATAACGLVAGAATATIGSDGESELLQGRIYSLIYSKDAAISDEDIELARSYVANRTIPPPLPPSAPNLLLLETGDALLLESGGKILLED